MKVLHIASEAVPFVKTGGLGDVVGALPKMELASGSDDIRVALPLYASVPKIYRRRMQPVGEVVVPLAWRQQPCRIYSLKQGGVIFYFFENEFYFDRDKVYGYHDDHERFAFFSKAVLEALPRLGFHAEVLHLHDWHTAPASVFLKTQYRDNPYYDNIKTVLTIHSMAYRGIFGKEIVGDVLGLSAIYASQAEMGVEDGVSYLQGGIRYADAVTTVSPSYAEALKKNGSPYPQDAREKLVGILNGIDIKTFNPDKDRELFVNYDCNFLKKREQNKIKLKEALELAAGDKPLVGMVARLTREKGLTVLLPAIERILSLGVQLVILGVGELAYQEELTLLEKRFQGDLAVCLSFDERMAKRIYAGSDMFLVPSLTEPCGLSAMIAMRYGSIVLASKADGLVDTVIPYGDKYANGFLFEVNDESSMLATIKEAAEMYPNKRRWNRLIRTAMGIDHSWQQSAREYLVLYRTLL